MADAEARERQKNLSLALVFSACAHLIVMLTLDISPGDWRHGFQPSLRVALREAPALDAAAERTAEPRATMPETGKAAAPQESGRTAAAAQPGSTLPGYDRYFKSSEVDEPAVAVQQGPLVFPENAYVWKLAGTVRARVFINEQGAVDSVQIVEARPHSGIFEEAALEALRQVKYEAAKIGGLAVKSQKLVEVTFNPYEDKATR